MNEWPLRYLSLFSGIGGFEVAIHRLFPNAVCVGYSEVKPTAIKVYKHHFPTHTNLGDISKITPEDIDRVVRDGCDLVVGGFPCKNLSTIASLTKNRTGLDGNHSGLFWEHLRVLALVRERCPGVHFIVENNASMKNEWRDTISRELGHGCVCTRIDARDYGVQCRDRLYWTTFPVVCVPDCQQRWEDILDDTQTVECRVLKTGSIECLNKPTKVSNRLKRMRSVESAGNGLFRFRYSDALDGKTGTRWQLAYVSNTMETQEYTPYPVGKSRPVIASAGTNNVLIDNRFGKDDEFLVRYSTSSEKERLFWLEPGWTSPAGSEHTRGELLGNTVVTKVIEKILLNFVEFNNSSCLSDPHSNRGAPRPGTDVGVRDQTVMLPENGGNKFGGKATMFGGRAKAECI